MPAEQLIYNRLKAWLRDFPNELRHAVRESEGLPMGWVWQKRFVDFFRRYEVLGDQLRDLDQDPPRGKARIDHAISTIDFFPHPKTGQEMIAYKTDRLREWAKAFSTWLNSRSS